TGRLWRDVGAVHEESGVSLNNRTILFDCMQGSLSDVSCVEGLSIQGAVRMLRRIDEIESRVPAAKLDCENSDLIKRELLATLAILRHAARRAATMVTRRSGRRANRDLRWLARDIPRIIDRHRDLWRARNRPGGLAHSLGYYRRNLGEYERAVGIR
ncbi:MAG: hypothetical protein O7D94_03365, partial [Planctomycetota bacterium]|nr:hypothetical protein [Planctomycetota bacterium]